MPFGGGGGQFIVGGSSLQEQADPLGCEEPRGPTDQARQGCKRPRRDEVGRGDIGLFDTGGDDRGGDTRCASSLPEEAGFALIGLHQGDRTVIGDRQDQARESAARAEIDERLALRQVGQQLQAVLDVPGSKMRNIARRH